MITLEQAILRLLVSDSAIAELIPPEKIFQFEAPQTIDYPCVSFRPPAEGSQEENQEQTETLTGDSGLNTEYIEVYSAGFDEEPSNIDRAIVKCLAGFHGEVFNTASPPESILIERIRLESGHIYIGRDAAKVRHFKSVFQIEYLDPLTP